MTTVNLLHTKYVYPAFVEFITWFNCQRYDFFSQLVARNDYFENEVAMNKMIRQKNFGMLDQPVNKDL